MKYFRAVDPPNIRRNPLCEMFGGCRPPKIFHGWGSVKYLGGLQPPNISRKGFCQIFGGSTAPKYFTEGVPSNIWGVYSPDIFHGTTSVKYFGGVDPPNI